MNQASYQKVLSTGPCAVTAAKELALGFDRWEGDDESLRLWTLEFTSRMRGSDEGQEGLSFLEKRSPIGNLRSDSMLKRTLVANRGEIACRILRACREAGIEGVAIYAENDSGTLFTELADIAVQLEGEGLAETYLNQEQILQIALDTGCDSIHPGFGFLSERADFAQAVMDSGFDLDGHSPEAITKMGDKMTARITMKEAGVPVIPGEEVTGGLEEVLQIAPSVGYPLLLKATAGGGGKECERSTSKKTWKAKQERQ